MYFCLSVESLPSIKVKNKIETFDSSSLFLGKRNRIVDVDDDFEYPDSGPLFSSPPSSSQILKEPPATPRVPRIIRRTPALNFDLDLSGAAPIKKYIPPCSVNLCGGVTLEIKSYKGSSYVCIAKTRSETAFVTRVNMPIEELDIFKKGLDALVHYVKSQ